MMTNLLFFKTLNSEGPMKYLQLLAWNTHISVHNNFFKSVPNRIPFFSTTPRLDVSNILFSNNKIFINTQNSAGILNVNTINSSNIFINNSKLCTPIVADPLLFYSDTLSLICSSDFEISSGILNLKKINPQTVTKQNNKLYVYDVSTNGLVTKEQSINMLVSFSRDTNLLKASAPDKVYISEKFNETQSQMAIYPITKSVSGLQLVVVSPIDLNDYQVFFEINLSSLSGLNPTYSNLRVYDVSLKKYIPFWIEETNPKRLWIKTNLIANKPATFVVFVDNTQISMNNPYSVFEFFDDFIDDTPDPTLYLEINNQQGQIYSDFANSKLIISSTGDFWGTADTAKFLLINRNFDFDYEAVARINERSFTAHNRFFGARTSSATNSRCVVFLVNNTTNNISLVYRTSDGGSATYYGDSTNITTPSDAFNARIIKTGTNYSFAINDVFLGSQPVQINLGTNTSYLFLASSHNLDNFVSFDYIYVKKYSVQESNFSKSVTQINGVQIEVTPIVVISTNNSDEDVLLATKKSSDIYPQNAVVSDFTLIPWNLIENGIISSDLSNISAKAQGSYISETVYIRGFAKKTPLIYSPLNTSGENYITIRPNSAFVKSSQSVVMYPLNTNQSFTILNPANVTQYFKNSHWIVSTGTTNLDWWGGVTNNTVRLLIPQPNTNKQIETKISYYNLVNNIHLGFAVAWNDQNAYLFGIMYDSSRQGVYLERIQNNSGTNSIDYVYFPLPQIIFLKVELSVSASGQKQILFAYSTDGYVWTYLRPQPYILSNDPSVYLMVKKWGTSTSTTVAFDYIKIYDGVAHFALNTYKHDPIFISKSLGTSISDTFNINFSGTVTSKHLSILSDVLTKSNISPIMISLNDINPIKYFDTIQNTERYGLIAQELEHTDPCLTKKITDLNTISYVELIPIMIKHLKKLYGDKYGLVQQ